LPTEKTLQPPHFLMVRLQGGLRDGNPPGYLRDTDQGESNEEFATGFTKKHCDEDG
jgi:hypothetical protein